MIRCAACAWGGRKEQRSYHVGTLFAECVLESCGWIEGLVPFATVRSSRYLISSEFHGLRCCFSFFLVSVTFVSLDDEHGRLNELDRTKLGFYFFLFFPLCITGKGLDISLVIWSYDSMNFSPIISPFF